VEKCEINVENRVAVVTGGAQGIGGVIAECLAKAGARVVVADLNAPEGEARHKGPKFIRTDITNPESVSSMVNDMVSSFGGVDILVNNAGIMYKSLVEGIDFEQWNQLLSVNVTGAVICTAAVVPHMKKQMWGRIVNMSSMQAFLGSPTYSAYTASKAGLSGLTRVWAAELAPYNITVNALCPSYAETPMMERSVAQMAREKNISKEEALARFVEPIPQKRILKAEEIAFAVLYLCSPLARGVTGHDMVIAAGMVMH
jgi:NAD(P)-dependent dehydrogenase (short-subunit alcohol dehydrogenase family)